MDLGVALGAVGEGTAALFGLETAATPFLDSAIEGKGEVGSTLAKEDRLDLERRNRLLSEDFEDWDLGVRRGMRSPVGLLATSSGCGGAGRV